MLYCLSMCSYTRCSLLRREWGRYEASCTLVTDVGDEWEGSFLLSHHDVCVMSDILLKYHLARGTRRKTWGEMGLKGTESWKRWNSDYLPICGQLLLLFYNSTVGLQSTISCSKYFQLFPYNESFPYIQVEWWHLTCKPPWHMLHGEQYSMDLVLVNCVLIGKWWMEGLLLYKLD